MQVDQNESPRDRRENAPRGVKASLTVNLYTRRVSIARFVAKRVSQYGVARVGLTKGGTGVDLGEGRCHAV